MLCKSPFSTGAMRQGFVFSGRRFLWQGAFPLSTKNDTLLLCQGSLRIGGSQREGILSDHVVNWLKVRTKVSVESLCVRIFGPKTTGRRFDTISNSWRTFELSASLSGRQATRCAGAGPLPSQSSLTSRTSRMAVPLKSDARIDPSGR